MDTQVDILHNLIDQVAHGMFAVVKIIMKCHGLGWCSLVASFLWNQAVIGSIPINIAWGSTNQFISSQSFGR